MIGRRNKEFLVQAAQARHHPSSLSENIQLNLTPSSSSSFPPRRFLSTAAVQHDPYDINCHCATCAYAETCSDEVFHVNKDDGFINSFHALDVPENFDIDLDQLKKLYRTLMTNYHPDKHYSNPNECQDIEHRASVVTRAYDILKDPHTRAVHLLEVLGQPMLDEAANGELVGSEFLMYIMEVRESISLTDDDRILKQMLDENRIRNEQTCNDLANAFAQHDYRKALELTAQLQYWHRIDETIRDKIDHID